MKTSYCLVGIAVVAATLGSLFANRQVLATPPAVPVPLPASPVTPAEFPKSPVKPQIETTLPPIGIDPDAQVVPASPKSDSQPKNSVPTPVVTAANNTPPSVTQPLTASMPLPTPAASNPSVLVAPTPTAPMIPAQKPEPAHPVTPTAVESKAGVTPVQPNFTQMASPLPLVPPPELPSSAPTRPSQTPTIPVLPLPTPSQQPSTTSQSKLPLVPPPDLGGLPNRAQPAVQSKLPTVPPPNVASLPIPAPSTAQSTAPTIIKPLTNPTQVAQAPVLPLNRKVVLTREGKLVEGSVTQSENKVIVRRGVIDQPLALDEVVFIANSKDEVYQHMLSKLNADDAAGHLKLARWCMFNGMRENALAETKTVAKLQPENRQARDLARTLEESIRLFAADGTPLTQKPTLPGPEQVPVQRSLQAPPTLPSVPPPSGLAPSSSKPTLPEAQHLPKPPTTTLPPPIPPAIELPQATSGVKFGQDAKPKPVALPDPSSTGSAVDEFDPSIFNRKTPK